MRRFTLVLGDWNASPPPDSDLVPTALTLASAGPEQGRPRSKDAKPLAVAGRHRTSTLIPLLDVFLRRVGSAFGKIGARRELIPHRGALIG